MQQQSGNGYYLEQVGKRLADRAYGKICTSLHGAFQQGYIMVANMVDAIK